MTEDYLKWEITIDLMMIIGKYLESNKDFINVMKLNKKFKQLVEMYYMNPISDISLFPNIQTQHFYKEEDVKNKKNNLFQYIYWYDIDYDYLSCKEFNEIFKKGFILKNKSIKTLKNEIENGILKIPDRVVNISEKYFDFCKEFTTLILPNSLKIINYCGFSHSNIKEVIIPENVEYLGNYCFFNCNMLSKITLNNKLKHIGEACFMNNNISNINLPNTLIDLLPYTFYHSSLQNITIPEGITHIGNKCFENCNNLTKVIFPDSLLIIDNNAFKNCIIKDMFLPENLKVIGDLSFSGNLIKYIYIPESIITLGINSFSNCIKLKMILLPKKFKNKLVGDGEKVYY